MALSLAPEVTAFLQRHHVMTLATQDGDGPWAAALFYATDAQDLVFLSAAGSRHARALVLQPRCAATIQGQEPDFSRIQGIQLEGVACQAQGSDCEQARRVYGERFPFVRAEPAPPAIAQALAHVQWYRLRISRLFFVDNARGFGQREEFVGSQEPGIRRASNS
jgi:uncharacterized protein